ncbi:MAG TPA: TM0106 family RecB-like putative nuclease [Acidimicrobiales bacterium]|nr:TM0106 family RecB-like putative nuclease [Acidimicrobiales bacterium]
MQLIDGDLVLSPTDLVGHLQCQHLTQLERQAAHGLLTRPERDDPELDILSRLGTEHEIRFLATLGDEGRSVVRIDTDDRTLVEAAADTVAAMKGGADVIYQATFFDGTWRGHADFLERVELPSDLGPWSYEPVDTKLARRVKAAAVLQLCEYARQIAAVQGVAPAHLHVVTGDRERHTIRLDDAIAYQGRVRTDLLDAAHAPRTTYPEPTGHCGTCRWTDVCDTRRRADDHLSLVAGLRRDQARKLRPAGVTTLTELAWTDPATLDGVKIGDVTFDRLHHQARLQLQQRATGVPTYELLEPRNGQGLSLLPTPSPGDVFFDIEGYPFAGDEGLEYLFGSITADTGAPVFTPFWAHSDDEEKVAFESFVDWVMARLARWPDLHVYHYAAYETVAMKRLMSKHGTREDEVDRLLRGEVFVDLFRVVRQGVRVSEESYSLKKIEHLYLPPEARQTAVADGASSIVAYERWLETGDQRVLDEIGLYNEVDCESTWMLRTWLEERRAEASIPDEVRPPVIDGSPSEAAAQFEGEMAALCEQLASSPPEERTLLAHLLQWHRREAKPDWWAHFARVAMTDEDLLDDPYSISGLVYEGEGEQVKRSIAHRYRFPAEQEHRFKVGDRVIDPATDEPAGVVHHIDAAAGELHLLRGKDSETPHPTAIIPDKPISDIQLRKALQRFGQSVLDGDVTAGPWAAGWSLLQRTPPRVDLALALAPVDVALALRRGDVLPIQGPPGAGKTYTGARMIAALVAAGKRVGVCANSHKAIGNLLAAVAEADPSIPILQKVREGEGCQLPQVLCTDDNKVVDAELEVHPVVGGTPWLFAREAMAGRLDVLFVDEAGQLSLANTCAIAGSAPTLVLLGDPQQLANPSKGTHPEGAAVSALEHLLGEHATVPADRGLFLDTSWRMHPDVCSFISEIAYERRLSSHPSCAVQHVANGPWVGGTGLRWVPVVHADNRVTSPEEVDEVVRGVDALLGRPFVGRDGVTRTLTIDDILVVAPYNAHVARLTEALPEGARVGTVDRFQGQEAPVVLFTMATSSSDDLPRGLDFLLSLNRLNVAISRAQALAVLVCSRALLEVQARSVRQLILANALCRFVEHSDEVAPLAGSLVAV